jgi:hypothetical protein
MIAARLIGLSLIGALAFLLAGCINNRGAMGPPPPYLQIEQCYTNPTAPAGYIRTGSKEELRDDCPQTAPGQLNILIFTRYDNLGIGSRLVVCADQQIPGGWEDISGGYHDPDGCDALAHPDPNFANVRKIYRDQ